MTKWLKCQSSQRRVNIMNEPYPGLKERNKFEDLKKNVMNEDGDLKVESIEEAGKYYSKLNELLGKVHSRYKTAEEAEEEHGDEAFVTVDDLDELQEGLEKLKDKLEEKFGTKKIIRAYLNAEKWSKLNQES